MFTSTQILTRQFPQIDEESHLSDEAFQALLEKETTEIITQFKNSLLGFGIEIKVKKHSQEDDFEYHINEAIDGMRQSIISIETWTL